MPKMPRLPRTTRQTRCERCILMHRPCDAQKPSCTNCSRHRDGPLNCVYPEGQPSRSELKKRKMDEAEERKAKLEEQAANRKAAVITHGFGEGKYGTVPDSWPEKYGGKGGYQKMIDASKLRGGEVRPGDEETTEDQKRKRRRIEKKDPLIENAVRGESPEVEIDVTQGFPSLAGGAPTYGPMEVRAPIAPSLGTPFDPHINPEWFNRTQTDATLDEIARNLVDSLENSLPKHKTGILKGLSDWSQVNAPPPATPELREEECQRIEAFVDRMYPILWGKDGIITQKLKKGKDDKS